MPFKKGVVTNPKGRPHKSAVEILYSALTKLSEEKRMHLIEKCVRDAYKDKYIAIAILKKILPDISASDLSLSHGTINIKFVPKTNNNDTEISKNKEKTDEKDSENNA